MKKTRILDLFCGAGGLASGFSGEGFEVDAVDIRPEVKGIFSLNRIGSARVLDLSTEEAEGDYDVVVGGPPCKPWSLINVTRRNKDHDNYHLISRFSDHIESIRPTVFLVENVIPARRDILDALSNLKKHGYRMAAGTVKYCDFGAPTSRHRLMIVGYKKGSPNEFFEELEKYKAPAKTVRDAIGSLENKKSEEVPDHIYPKLKTIHKYRKYYKTGKREALLLMGFDNDFVFPEGMGMGLRYQMASDAVSPIFSSVAAKAMKDIMTKESK
ncbi:MAG: DNA cytosine methyltransferase [Candidatus Thorarchaeota archaeon]|jgi:DNA (cytosine-5)-methyltransferase 1